jgi:cysteinyl-tRNA synthetase
MVLNSSYRGPLTFNEDIVAQAERALERLRSATRPALSSSDQSSDEDKLALATQMATTKQGFIEAMDDDFNTAGALGCLFDLVRLINQARDAGMDNANLKAAQDLLVELTSMLGLRLIPLAGKSGQAEPFIDLLVEARTEIRKQKLWSLADMIRKRLEELEVLLEDGKEGTTWRWK